MGDYCIGEPESIFTIKVERTTGDQYHCYKEDFFRWALQQSKQELNEWYKEASKGAMGCQHASCHAEIDFGYLKEALKKFSSYEQYHESLLNNLLQAAKQYVRESLLFEDSQIKSSDLLYIYPLFSSAERIKRLLKQVEEGTKLLSIFDPDTILQRLDTVWEKMKKMNFNSDEWKKLNQERSELYKASVWMIEKETVETEIKEIFSTLERGIDTHTFLLIEQIHYDSEIKRKHILSKNFKNKEGGKRLKEKFDKIDFLYKVASEAGTRHDDIYRKIKRLAGSGWSKQK